MMDVEEVLLDVRDEEDVVRVEEVEERELLVDDLELVVLVDDLELEVLLDDLTLVELREEGKVVVDRVEPAPVLLADDEVVPILFLLDEDETPLLELVGLVESARDELADVLVLDKLVSGLASAADFCTAALEVWEF